MITYLPNISSSPHRLRFSTVSAYSAPDSKVGEERLDRALALAQRTVRETRYIIENLRPTALDDFGLAAAIRLRVEYLEKEGWHIDYEEALGDERLNPEIETALYRVTQEALTNVQKHAQTKRAYIKLTYLRRKVRLEVRDEGCGFDPFVSKEKGSGRGEKVGLAGMRERVALLGGEIEIMSKPGSGTSLVAEVPLPASESRKGNGRAERRLACRKAPHHRGPRPG